MSIKYYSDECNRLQRLTIRLAKNVLSLAAQGGMPDTYWHTDSRIRRACKVLNWTPEQARTWAEG